MLIRSSLLQEKRKRHKKSSHADRRRVSPVDSESGESSECDQDNWAMLADVWPVDQRPDYLKVRRNVNKRDFGQLLQFEKLFRERRKIEGRADNLFGEDAAPPAKKFKAAKDDRMEKFHDASFLRLPLAEPEIYWKLVPMKREPVFRGIPLVHVGAENQVNELAIVRMHDRGTPVTLKMFCGANYAKRPEKDSAMKDSEWEAPAKLKCLQ